ncbi:MAG: 5'/3'-nucleotidase SurE [Candidatus Sericytochromatia bacterium]
MKILVSNDDGIFAPGIKALSETLAKRHEVYVAAPDRERSANSHALTLNKPLRAEEITIFKDVKASWHINGTPADCVKIALGSLLDFEPDLVISGINRGQNMGTDVIYSGTVSAAMEGNILGIQSIAVSLASFDDKHYQTAADFILDFIENFKTASLPPKTLLNVNVPSIPNEEVKGFKITKLGIHKYMDVIERREDLRGKVYYWLGGSPVEHNDDHDTDTEAVKSKFISITPIHYDLTNYDFMSQLSNWKLDSKIEVKK